MEEWGGPAVTGTARTFSTLALKLYRARRLPNLSRPHPTPVGRVLFAISFANKQIGGFRGGLSY
jgi:hypothetical protein